MLPFASATGGDDVFRGSEGADGGGGAAAAAGAGEDCLAGELVFAFKAAVCVLLTLPYVAEDLR